MKTRPDGRITLGPDILWRVGGGGGSALAGALLGATAIRAQLTYGWNAGALFGLTLGVLVLALGLKVALAARTFTFVPDSACCVVRTDLLGWGTSTLEVRVSEVDVVRRFDWQMLRWLYGVVLHTQEERSVLRVGFAGSQSAATRIKEKIEAFIA